jgi:hypothetical protein
MRLLWVAGLCVAGLVAVAALGISLGAADSRDDARAFACKPVWRTAPSPRVAQGTLNAVAVVSATDAWAVGGVVRLGGVSGGEVVSGSPLIERWNGTRWSVVPSPKISGDLTDVAATSPRDAWAVGFVPRSEKPLILHWDGRRWSQVELPTEVGSTYAVAAISPKDVWAVGTTHPGYQTRGEISHWDGRTWTRLTAVQDAALKDVVALSPRDVWVVGTEEWYRALMLHWDGSRWQRFEREATSGFDEAWLLSVGAASAKDVWAGGGEHQEEMSPPAIGPLMLHWDGKRWSNARLPGYSETEFVGIAPISSKDVLAVSSNSWSYELQGASGFGAWLRTGNRWRMQELPRGWELYGVGGARLGGRTTRDGDPRLRDPNSPAHPALRLLTESRASARRLR